MGVSHNIVFKETQDNLNPQKSMKGFLSERGQYSNNTERQELFFE